MRTGSVAGSPVVDAMVFAVRARTSSSRPSPLIAMPTVRAVEMSSSAAM
jgi:hypothetical protein